MTVARIVLDTAIIIVFPNDERSAVLSHSLIYQSKVNPFQLRYGFDVVALNEFVTTTKIGMNKNK